MRPRYYFLTEKGFFVLSGKPFSDFMIMTMIRILKNKTDSIRALRTFAVPDRPQPTPNMLLKQHKTDDLSATI